MTSNLDKMTPQIKLALNHEKNIFAANHSKSKSASMFICCFSK